MLNQLARISGLASIAMAPTASLATYSLYLQALALYRTYGGIGVSMPLGVCEDMSFPPLLNSSV